MQLETYLDETLATKQSTIAKDLKLNLKRLMTEGALDSREAYMSLLALASAVEDGPLKQLAREKMKEQDFTEEQIIEAADSAAMMAMLNVYYRFRHMLKNGQGMEVVETYKMAGLRMTALARPALGKEQFEMLSFAVSVLNGCESCINSHELVLRQAGITTDKIHDLARLASVVKAIKTLSAI